MGTQVTDMLFNLSLLFGGISLAMGGLLMTAQWLAPELTQQYKRQIPDIIRGLVLVLIASTIMAIFTH